MKSGRGIGRSNGDHYLGKHNSVTTNDYSRHYGADEVKSAKTLKEAAMTAMESRGIFWSGSLMNKPAYQLRKIASRQQKFIEQLLEERKG